MDTEWIEWRNRWNEEHDKIPDDLRGWLEQDWLEVEGEVQK